MAPSLDDVCASIERALAHIPDIFERVFGSPEHTP